MTQTPFAPPPGMISDDTVFSMPGRWADGSMARFFEGGWQVKGGWERLTLDNLGGVCRSVLGWTDFTSIQVVAFGLHNGLKVWEGSLVSDITPTFNFPAVTLGANPLATTNLSPVVVVTQAGHGYTTGQTIVVSGAALVGGITPNGGPFAITVINANSYSYVFGANATATVAAGGGAAVAVQNQLAWQAGQIDGTGGSGYGTGAFGVGTYGTPSTADYFPLTWSLGTYGSDLIANPRGRGIYRWQQNPLARAAILPGAPKQVTYTVVAPQRQVMALGCNESVSGLFNPLCIRWSDIEDPTDWIAASNNNAGEWILESGGRIVCGRIIGDYVFVWTTDGLFMGTFVGAPGQTWKFERIGAQCGAISPGAPIIKSQVAAWISPDRVFWSCTLGGAPTVIECPVRQVFVDHITQGQDDKVVGGTTSTFNELSWFWPDNRDGFECSRSLNFSTKDGWSHDMLPRSAYVDAGPQPFPVGVKATGQVYWHEKGHSDDGSPLAGFIESADFYLSEADEGVMVNGVKPDFKDQLGPLMLTLKTREFPQSAQRPHGPWSLAPGQSKRSFRLAGRVVSVRWEWSSAPAYARGGKPEFDVQQIGGRG